MALHWIYLLLRNVPSNGNHAVDAVVDGNHVGRNGGVPMDAVDVATHRPGDNLGRPVDIIRPSLDGIFVAVDDLKDQVKYLMISPNCPSSPIGGLNIPAGRLSAWWLTIFSDHFFVTVYVLGRSPMRHCCRTSNVSWLTDCRRRST